MDDGAAMARPGTWMPGRAAGHAVFHHHATGDERGDGGVVAWATTTACPPPQGHMGERADEGEFNRSCEQQQQQQQHGSAAAVAGTPQNQMAAPLPPRAPSARPPPLPMGGLPSSPPPGGWLSLHVPSHLWPEFFFRCTSNTFKYLGECFGRCARPNRLPPPTDP